MVDKQIRIDITSRDDASATLDDVADSAETLEQLQPEVTVTADASAARSDLTTVDDLVEALDARAAEVAVTADTSPADRAISDVDADADALSKLTPEIAVTADTSAADNAISDVDTATKALTDADREIVLKAKISDAKAALKDLRGDLDTTADKADDVKRELDNIGTSQGPALSSQAIGDLTGPLGDASGAAGDFGEAVSGLSEIAEGVGTKFGIEMGGITSALGGASFAVAGIAAAITYFAGKAEEARKKQEELAAAVRDYNDALDEGDWRAAADQLTAMFEDPFDAAEDLGFAVDDVAKYITGAAESLPKLDRALTDNARAIEDTKRAQDAYYDSTGFLNQRLVDTQEQLLATRGRLRSFRDSVSAARRQLDDTNGVIATQNTRTRTVARALKDASKETDNLKTSQDKARESTERLDEALGRLKDQLSFERTMLRFEEDFAEAFRKVKRGRELTSGEILGLKENVLDVAEFARLNPAQVRALLRRIERGEIASVRDAVQQYMNDHTVETPAGVKYVGGAAEARNQGQADMDRQPPVQIPTEYQINWESYYRATHPTNPNPGAAVTNVTMYLPRGYREQDTLTAVHAAARRSGGYYHRRRA